MFPFIAELVLAANGGFDGGAQAVLLCVSTHAAFFVVICVVVADGIRPHALPDLCLAIRGHFWIGSWGRCCGVVYIYVCVFVRVYEHEEKI